MVNNLYIRSANHFIFIYCCFLFLVLNKSGSESSISEACDSVKETSKRFEAERDDCSDNAEETKESRKKLETTNNELELPRDLMSKRGSLTSAKSLHEFKHESIERNTATVNASKITTKKTRCSSHKTIDSNCPACSNNVAPSPKKTFSEDDVLNKGRGIRPSKSDTSLTDTFVVVDNEYNKKKNLNSLREGKFIFIHYITSFFFFLQVYNFKGFKWQRQLVFRSKLTMHTAYDRKDNTEPASITALAVSKDHKTLYVGDARGRVYSWSVTEQPGRGMADHWLKDEGADQCVACHVR